MLVLFGFVAPRALEIVYIACMSLAFTMDLLVFAVVLMLCYFNYLIGLRGIGLCLWALCQQSCSGVFFGCGKDSGSYQSHFLLLLGAILVVGQGSVLAPLIESLF